MVHPLLRTFSDLSEVTMQRKFVLMILALAAAFRLAACGKTEQEKQTDALIREMSVRAANAAK